MRKLTFIVLIALIASAGCIRGLKKEAGTSGTIITSSMSVQAGEMRSKNFIMTPVIYAYLPEEESRLQ